MTHTVIIVEQVVLPPPDAQAAVTTGESMKARVEYTPADTATPSQIGEQVERIVKRLAKLADD